MKKGIDKVKGASTGFFKGFKDFISRGNVVDMAVGVIIGGAFGKIVTSLVNDVIMPAVGMLFGKVKFTELKHVIEPAVLAEDGVTVVTPEVAITYGNFIQNIVDFLIIAFCVFMMVKLINGMRRKAIAKEEAAKEEAAKAAKEAAEAEAAVVEKRDATQEAILETLKKIEADMKK